MSSRTSNNADNVQTTEQRAMVIAGLCQDVDELARLVATGEARIEELERRLKLMPNEEQRARELLLARARIAALTEALREHLSGYDLDEFSDHRALLDAPNTAFRGKDAE